MSFQNLKKRLFFLKKNLFVLSMWKLTLGYGIEEHTSQVWPEVDTTSLFQTLNPKP